MKEYNKADFDRLVISARENKAVRDELLKQKTETALRMIKGIHFDKFPYYYAARNSTEIGYQQAFNAEDTVKIDKDVEDFFTTSFGRLTARYPRIFRFLLSG